MTKKAIGSRVYLRDETNKYAAEFMSYIEEYLELDPLKKMLRYDQHFGVSRLQHSVNVAYYSYRIAKMIGADPKKAARAGMLHDLYYYDWHVKKTPQLHAYFHPRLALKNAQRLVPDLSKEEKDAILKHMWPLYWGIPKYKVSYCVTLADKYAATLEVCYNWGGYFGKKALGIFKKQK
ncbi:MAG: HD domain-containing protein [Firmicutes bacterium]|nr:HD domain-containing protein [Bacillota bacterium]